MNTNSGPSVANALFECHDRVGDYTLPLDHSVLVRSDICQLGSHRDMWAYVCVHDIRRHHVSRSGSLIGLRGVARLG